MPQIQVSIVPSFGRVVVHDFTRGSRIIQAPRLRRETENDAMAHALWLENHGRAEEADEYLEAYLQRSSQTKH